MKQIFTCFFVIAFFCTGFLYSQEPGPLGGDPPDPLSEYQSQDPTYSNFPKPEEVLVVYDTTITESRNLKSHYMSVRNIPAVNQVGLTLVDTAHYGNTFAFRWRSNGNHPHEEIVSHSDSASWLYYWDYIGEPIESYLNNTMVNGQPLASKIKYIVLMRGLPFRLIRWDLSFFTYRWNMSISALLCLLNQPDSTKNFMQLYNTYYRNYKNPLFGIDSEDYTFDYRFKSNHYVNAQGWYMQYLVSWLHGYSYSQVESIIDKAANPDYSGNGIWIIDDHKPRPQNIITDNFHVAYEWLKNTGFKIRYDTTSTWITQDSNKVMGYVSWGTWAGMSWNYILNLQFSYLNGAIFGSWESFNAQSFGVHRENPSPNGQGLIVDFLNMQGTGGSGHSHEPYATGVTHQKYSFPAYALGYSMVDANYFGIPLLAWQNLVVGDPLSSIAWGKQTLYEDKILSDTNLITGVITIPVEHTLTLEDETVLNFRHNGFVTGDGFVDVEGDFTINILDWSESVLKSRDVNAGNIPKLIWGHYPHGFVEYYLVHRKVNDEGSWEPIAELDNEAKEFVDEEFEISGPSGERPWRVDYKVEAITGSPSPNHSNEIVYDVVPQLGFGEMITSTLEESFSWKLSDNFPNPFNPITNISYEVAHAGNVELKVYNVLGQVVAVLVDEVKNPGIYGVQFDARHLSSGIYFYTIKAGNFIDTKRMVLLK